MAARRERKPRRMKPAKRKRTVETKKMMALAYNDAVRDILQSDGVFKLSDDRRRDAIWEWDGVTWKHVPLDAPRAEAPLFDLHDDDGSAASAG